MKAMLERQPEFFYLFGLIHFGQPKYEECLSEGLPGISKCCKPHCVCGWVCVWVRFVNVTYALAGDCGHVHVNAALLLYTAADMALVCSGLLTASPPAHQIALVTRG